MSFPSAAKERLSRSQRRFGPHRLTQVVYPSPTADPPGYSHKLVQTRTQATRMPHRAAVTTTGDRFNPASPRCSGRP